MPESSDTVVARIVGTVPYVHTCRGTRAEHRHGSRFAVRAALRLQHRFDSFNFFESFSTGHQHVHVDVHSGLRRHHREAQRLPVQMRGRLPMPGRKAHGSRLHARRTQVSELNPSVGGHHELLLVARFPTLPKRVPAGSKLLLQEHH